MARIRTLKSKYVSAPPQNRARFKGGASGADDTLPLVEPTQILASSSSSNPFRGRHSLPNNHGNLIDGETGSLALHDALPSFGDNGVPDHFDDHDYLTDQADRPQAAHVLVPSIASFNTPAASLLTDAHKLPKPLIRFFSWHQLVNRLTPLAPSVPGAFQPQGTLVCSCSLNTQVGYDVRVIRQVRTHLHRVRSCKDHLVDTLILAGAFPAAPILPRVAIDTAILRLYVATSNWSNASDFGYAHALLEASGAMIHNDGLRKLLQSASIWYSALRHYAHDTQLQSARMWTKTRPLVSHDDLALTFSDLLNRCPACFYSLSDEASKDKSMAHSPRHPQLIVAIDGNFTQRRLADLDLVQRSALPPAFFLSAQQVSAVADAMAKEPVTEPGAADGDNEDKTVPSSWHACKSNVLAADERAAKAASGPCDITGVMGLCCRHDVPLVFCDIDTPGERHHYAIALLRHLTNAVPNLERVGVLYDIGCRFPAKKNVKTLFTVTITWAVSVFHVFGHSYQCQILYSPRRIAGFGWSDGEGMERIWSSLSTLIVAARSMSHGDRRHVLEQRLQHHASRARAGLLIHLKTRLSSMAAVIADARAVLKAPTTRQLILPRYESMGLARRTWLLSAAHTGSDSKICHVLSRLKVLRCRKVIQPVPPDDELPDHQRFAMQLLARLGSIRQGHQQIQGRQNKGVRGTAIVKAISRNLATAKNAAYELLPKLNEAVRVRSRTHLEPFSPLQRQDLFSDAAYRWVARETQQYSAWWSNPVASAAIDAYEELERLHEESVRIRLEMRSAIVWLKASITDAFASDSTANSAYQLDIMRIYLSWYSPNARKRFSPPAAQDRYPWALPPDAQKIVDTATQVIPVQIHEEEQELVNEAVKLLRAGIINPS
ncbi:unnamed protein product [Tilletia caries]|nr:unnamed protein product [Tilletia caries]